MCNCNDNSSSANENFVLNQGCLSSNIGTEILFSDGNLVVVDKATNKVVGTLNLSCYVENITQYSSTKLSVPANGNLQIGNFGEQKIIALYFKYNENSTNQWLTYKINHWLVNPITNELSADFELDPVDYNSFYPTTTINISDTIDVGDTITIGDIDLVADVDFAIGVDAATSASNIISAVEDNEVLDAHVTVTYNAPNLIVTAKKATKSYTTIQTAYTATGASTNAAATETLESDILIDDSVGVVNEMLLLNVPTEQKLSTLTLYNYSGYDVCVYMLSAK